MPASGASRAGRSSRPGRKTRCTGRAVPAAALVGQLALGFGLVFLRSLAAQFHDRADHRTRPKAVERHAQL